MTLVVVSGIHYGGTSAVAGAVHLLGFPVDQGSNIGNEDSAVMRVKGDRGKFRRLIEERNEVLGDWAFKVPNLSVDTMKWLDEEFEDVRFVYVTRCPCATSTSKSRRPDVSRRYVHTLGLLDNYRWALNSLEGLDVFVCSYERLCRDPAREAGDLAEWLGVEYDERVAEYVSSSSYRSVTEFVSEYE